MISSLWKYWIYKTKQLILHALNNVCMSYINLNKTQERIYSYSTIFFFLRLNRTFSTVLYHYNQHHHHHPFTFIFKSFQILLYISAVKIQTVRYSMMNTACIICWRQLQTLSRSASLPSSLFLEGLEGHYCLSFL